MYNIDFTPLRGTVADLHLAIYALPRSRSFIYQISETRLRWKNVSEKYLNNVIDELKKWHCTNITIRKSIPSSQLVFAE